MITHSVPPHKLRRMVSSAWRGQGVVALKDWVAAHPEEAVHAAARDSMLRALLERWEKEKWKR